MTVLINFKICDNSPDCNCIKDCPVRAFYFDEKNDTIAVDHVRCTNCGRCAKSCLVGAVKVARSQEEQIKFKQEIDADPRTVRDLFVDRYGAAPISNKFTIKMQEFEKAILKSTKFTVLELYNDDSIECLIKSIPIKELFTQDIVYRKMEANDEILAEYDISTLPCLLFFEKGELKNKIEGFVGENRKEELIKNINKIIN